MSRMLPTKREGSLAATLRFAFNQMVKSLHTAMPGEIVSYDPATRRATVFGLLDVVDVDNVRHPRPTISDVPVVFPSGGGHQLIFPLAAGDPVLLVYSMRGIGNWKVSGGRSEPDPGEFYNEDDVIAIPGFGAHPAASPAVAGAAVLQSADGGSYVAVGNDGVRIVGATGLVGQRGTEEILLDVDLEPSVNIPQNHAPGLELTQEFSRALTDDDDGRTLLIRVGGLFTANADDIPYGSELAIRAGDWRALTNQALTVHPGDMHIALDVHSTQAAGQVRIAYLDKGPNGRLMFKTNVNNYYLANVRVRFAAGG